MTQKLQELYDYLESNYECLDKDLSLEQAQEENDEATIFPEQDEDLSRQPYVCCEQKLIWYKDGGYIVACLYNTHPTMKYETIKEVADFLRGNAHIDKPYLDYQDKLGDPENSKAYNDGLYAHFYHLVATDKYHFDKNVVSTILFKEGYVSTIYVATEKV
jgi:hypothetical protein